MKKLFSLLLISLLLCGCGKNTAKDAVESYLKKYKTLNSEVLLDLERVIDKENLEDEEKTKYRNILKKQYKDLNYQVTEEEYDNDITYITVKIEVYDLKKAQDDAYIYMENHSEEFKDENGNIDEDKYLNYKLDKMKDTTERREYEIVFTVTKEDKEYVVEQPTETDLLKIHGVYNYDLS